MASSSAWKSIYEQHYHAEECLKEYFAPESKFLPDSVLQTIKNLDKVFASGDLKGDNIIFYGSNHAVYLLLPACDHFKEITVINFLDSNRQCLEKWLKNDPETFQWSQVLSLVYGHEERKKCAEKEENLRRAIKRIVKSDVTDSALAAPASVPQADCLLTAYCLEKLCSDIDAYIMSVKNMASLLKVGGYMVMHVIMECTYSMIGKIKLPILFLQEESVVNILSDLGFVIKERHLSPRVNTTQFAVMDYSGVLFLVARKEREVQ